MLSTNIVLIMKYFMWSLYLLFAEKVEWLLFAVIRLVNFLSRDRFYIDKHKAHIYPR